MMSADLDAVIPDILYREVCNRDMISGYMQSIFCIGCHILHSFPVKDHVITITRCTANDEMASRDIRIGDRGCDFIVAVGKKDGHVTTISISLVDCIAESCG